MIDQINIRGEYQEYDDNGNPISYSIGDVVDFNEKTYIANVNNPDHPYIENSGWYQIARGSIFFKDSSVPKFVRSGDKWFDTSTGIMYTMVIQDNGYMHWVEL